MKYWISEDWAGSWEYQYGDIIGIDKRTFVRTNLRGYVVINETKQKQLKKLFKTKAAAKRYIKMLKARGGGSK